MTNAPAGGYDVVMLSNNSGDQIVPAAVAAQEAGTTVVTWDSPIPTGEGESLFVAQVDFDETGQVMADMARSILGEDGGQFAILSASPDAANQNAWIAAMETALEDPQYANLELLEIVYGDDQSEKSYEQALALISKHPDMELIMAPTSVGIVAAAKALQDEGLCDEIKVSGLGVPAEMLEYTQNGCAPEFALWSFVDLGYLTYYVSYLLATGAIEGVEGETLRRRPPGRVRDHQGSDPTRRRRPARPDGPVHGLQHRQRRGSRRIAVRRERATTRSAHHSCHFERQREISPSTSHVNMRPGFLVPRNDTRERGRRKWPRSCRVCPKPSAKRSCSSSNRARWTSTSTGTTTSGRSCNRRSPARASPRSPSTSSTT